MIGFDTNILVRYLTKDDEKQWKQAAEIIERGEQCFVANRLISICREKGERNSKSFPFKRFNY
ncbi:MULTISPECIES: hypothetical protein [unclassified Nostoc]|uniref:hypothetical protein n=1 Tax=unclassified Nostoc TaxID=2593658 RepID=UPI002ADA1F79|nr:hypothetical protein [Nostoc sp. DedQUE02]